MNIGGGGSAAQWQVAPTYSELFGFGLRTAIGGYVTEDFALGAIIDVGEYRNEYLANAGIHINDSMRLIGSVGILKEQEEFVQGEGREDVQQREYGLGLKGNYDAGIIRGFEVNAYHTNGNSDADSVETGDLTGLQFVTQLQPADGTDLRIGTGYERAKWDGGAIDEGFTLQALGAHQLSDTLSMNFEAKSAETENVYAVGLTQDLSNADIRNSRLNVDLMRIEAKHGISDDTRIAVNWTVGFGAASRSSDEAVSSTGSIARADLLADVMTRPAFLPERVLTRAAGATFDAVACAASFAGAITYYQYINSAHPFNISAVTQPGPYAPPANGQYVAYVSIFDVDLQDFVFEYIGFANVLDGIVTMTESGRLLAQENYNFILADASNCAQAEAWYID